MNRSLTTKSFWLKYWKTKNLVIDIKKNYPFADLFNKYCKNKNFKTFLEIGGFPGYFAVYFSKYLGFKSYLLDFVINQTTISKLLRKNNLHKKDLTVYEQDFFKLSTQKKYDVVFSSGFIEHFDNFNEVINKHWQLTKKGGIMFIILPNLLGLNGHIQLFFDPDNLNIHNLKSMDLNALRKIAKKLKPKSYQVNYYGGLSIWLENLNSKSIFHKLMVYSIYVIGKVIKLLGINSKFTSPFIYIMAQK